jgi:hypothetical protein
MKTAGALGLSIAIASPAGLAAARDSGTARAGPIARAVAREAARFDPAQQAGQPFDADWARVKRLEPGTQITLAIRGSQAGARYFVLATDDDLTVINLTHPAIPADAQAVLRGVAARHPEYFAAAQNGGIFVLEGNVRLGPDGVFVGDRKVTDPGSLAERTVRADVSEIRTLRRTRGSIFGAVGGAAGGFLLGGVLALNLAFKNCGGGCGDEKALIGLSLVGLPVAGGLLGYHAVGRKMDVIYRAP